MRGQEYVGEEEEGFGALRRKKLEVRSGMTTVGCVKSRRKSLITGMVIEFKVGNLRTIAKAIVAARVGRGFLMNRRGAVRPTAMLIRMIWRKWMGVWRRLEKKGLAQMR